MILQSAISYFQQAFTVPGFYVFGELRLLSATQFPQGIGRLLCDATSGNPTPYDRCFHRAIRKDDAQCNTLSLARA